MEIIEAMRERTLKGRAPGKNYHCFKIISPISIGFRSTWFGASFLVHFHMGREGLPLCRTIMNRNGGPIPMNSVDLSIQGTFLIIVLEIKVSLVST